MIISAIGMGREGIIQKIEILKDGKPYVFYDKSKGISGEYYQYRTTI